MVNFNEKKHLYLHEHENYLISHTSNKLVNPTKNLNMAPLQLYEKCPQSITRKTTMLSMLSAFFYVHFLTAEVTFFHYENNASYS